MAEFFFFNKQLIEQSWGWIFLRGVLALLFAAALLLWPAAAVVTLAWVWGIFIFVDGLFCILAAWKVRASTHRPWVYILWGILSMLAGLVASCYPGLTAFVLVSIMGIWAIFSGILQIASGFGTRHVRDSFWSSVLFGIIAILFGAMLFARPLEGVVAIAWIIAFYSIIVGCFFISISLKLHKAAKLSDTL